MTPHVESVVRWQRFALVHPRIILLWAILAIFVALGLYLVAPWILPVRIREGPLIQMTTEEAATIVWFTTRPTMCTATVTIDGQARTQAATANGNRNQVRLTGLSAAQSYPYEIRVGHRRLGPGHVLQTNRPRGERCSFLVLGDSGLGSRAQYLLAGDMVRSEAPADFVLHTGDLVYPDGARRRYEERFFAPYRPLLERVVFWPCLGNHDVDPNNGTAPAYTAVFELPDNGPPGLPHGHNYWFDYADCRVAVIDSNCTEDRLRDPVAPWLREIMADPAPHWRFVSFHHPPYTGGKYAPDVGVQRALVPALEAAGVDVVFNGHDHMYQRTYPLRRGEIVSDGTGVVYVITAAGGARIYSAAPQRPPYIAVLDDQHHSFTHVTMDHDELSLRQIALGGEVIDEWRLRPRRDIATTQPTTADTNAR